MKTVGVGERAWEGGGDGGSNLGIGTKSKRVAILRRASGFSLSALSASSPPPFLVCFVFVFQESVSCVTVPVLELTL